MPFPNLNCAIIAASGEGLAIGTEGDGTSGAGVTREGADFAACFDLP